MTEGQRIVVTKKFSKKFIETFVYNDPLANAVMHQLVSGIDPHQIIEELLMAYKGIQNEIIDLRTNGIQPEIYIVPEGRYEELKLELKK